MAAGGKMVPHVTWCEAHKKKSFHKKHARQLIRQLTSGRMREFPCRYDITQPDGSTTTVDTGLWHVGHLPQAAVYGIKSAWEVYYATPDEEPEAA